MGSNSQTGSDTNTQASDQWGLIHAPPVRGTHTYARAQKHTRNTMYQLKYIKPPLFTVYLNYKILKPSEFVLAVLCVLENSVSNRERGLFHTQAQVFWANKPSCHIVTLCRRNMGKLLCTHRVECSLWANIVSEFTPRWHTPGTVYQVLITWRKEMITVCFSPHCARFTEFFDIWVGYHSGEFLCSSGGFATLYKWIHLSCLDVWTDKARWGDLKSVLCQDVTNILQKLHWFSPAS